MTMGMKLSTDSFTYGFVLFHQDAQKALMALTAEGSVSA